MLTRGLPGHGQTGGLRERKGSGRPTPAAQLRGRAAMAPQHSLKWKPLGTMVGLRAGIVLRSGRRGASQLGLPSRRSAAPSAPAWPVTGAAAPGPAAACPAGRCPSHAFRVARGAKLMCARGDVKRLPRLAWFQRTPNPAASQLLAAPWPAAPHSSISSRMSRARASRAASRPPRCTSNAAWARARLRSWGVGVWGFGVLRTGPRGSGGSYG